MDATAQFTASDAARILQSTEVQVRTWARLGGIAGRPRPDGRPAFTFQDLLLLRTTRGLLEAGIPPRRVRRVWSSLRRQLSADLPLTSVRILADGHRAVAWDGTAPWQPDSGQFLLDFEAVEMAERAEVVGFQQAAGPGSGVSPSASLRSAEDDLASLAMLEGVGTEVADAPALSAEQWFHIGSELENASPLEARQAYIQALGLEPGYADAHINLGRLFHEAGELGKAEAHYRDAARHAPDDATAHFNLGVLLEDRGRPEEAILAYRQAIAREPDAADAHYNLGILLEARGRRADALRHLMIARQLYAPSGG